MRRCRRFHFYYRRQLVSCPSEVKAFVSTVSDCMCVCVFMCCGTPMVDELYKHQELARGSKKTQQRGGGREGEQQNSAGFFHQRMVGFIK